MKPPDPQNELPGHPFKVDFRNPSWGPLGSLLGALEKNVGADGAVFNMISTTNKVVSETVAPRGPFFPSKNAISYCILQYIFDIGLIGPKSDF